MLSLTASKGRCRYTRPRGRSPSQTAGGQRRRQLLERRRAKEMMHEPDNARGVRPAAHPPWRQQRQLVEILDQHVVIARDSTCDRYAPYASSGNVCRVPTRCTWMPSSIAVRRTARPATAEQRDFVARAPPARPKISCRCVSAPPACGFSRSCQLTTRMRTGAIRPSRRHVRADGHRRPVRRASASSTPLTNCALWPEP